MKRFIPWFIAALILCLCVCASAEIGNTAGREDESELIFIGLDDIGFPIETLLNAIDFSDIVYTTDKSKPEPIMDDGAVAALMEYQVNAGLEPSGAFDPETTASVLLIYDCRFDELVWIPMHGGHKYHRSAMCSNMIEPRMVPVECAAALDFSACKRCYD